MANDQSVQLAWRAPRRADYFVKEKDGVVILLAGQSPSATFNKMAPSHQNYNSYFKPVLKLYGFGFADYHFLFWFRNDVYL